MGGFSEAGTKALYVRERLTERHLYADGRSVGIRTLATILVVDNCEGDVRVDFEVIALACL